MYIVNLSAGSRKGQFFAGRRRAVTQEYTIDDIAAELGVSKTTVSRAISGTGRISGETRRRVLELIEKRGYRPSAVAKGLAKSRTYNIGAVLPVVDVGREFAFFRECLVGICEYAASRDYDVVLTMGDDPSKIRRILENSKVDGLIAARSEEGSQIEALIAGRGVPFVRIGSSDDGGVVCVDNANALAAAEMTERLIDLGAGRLALLGGSARHFVTRDRAVGFDRACDKRGVTETRTFLNITDRAEADRAVTAAISGGCEAMVCMDNIVCDLVMQSLAAHGVSVPEQIRVACLYDSVIVSRMDPPVTAVRFDGVKLGAEACRQVIELIEGREAHSVVIPDFEIIMRKST